MVISHNLLAMNAQRQFNITGTQKKKSTEKLASGYRINRAADDAAGLAISEKMRRQIRGLDQGARNTQDGISLLQVADGALSEVHDMLHRMNELAIQAANGTNTLEDRKAIQQEIDQIKGEIGRIGDSTTFNERFIFKGLTEEIPVTGENYVESKTDGIAIDGTTRVYYEEQSEEKFKVTVAFSNRMKSTEANLSVSVGDNQYILSDTYEGLISQMQNENIVSNRSVVYSHHFYINPQIYGHDWATKDSQGNYHQGNYYSYYDSQFTAIVNANTYNQYYVKANMFNRKALKDENGNDVRTQIEVLMDQGGSGLQYSLIYTCMIDKNNDGIDDDQANMISIDKYRDYIKDHLVSINSNEGKNDASVNLINTRINKSAFYWEFEVTKPKEIAGYKKVTKDLQLWIQTGADCGDGLNLTIPQMNEKVIGVKDVSVLSESSAKKAIDKISNAIETISEARSKLGAQQNRLEHTYKNVTNVVENTQAAESRIRDTDMAKEMVELSKHNILEQAGTTMITQANQTNQGVLNLLQ